ncbi:hypothetical protein SGPA1_40895 [Streptomyces misionensis JCM 4497]
MVLARSVLRPDQRRGHRGARRLRRGTAHRPVDHAPLPDRRGRPPRGAGRHGMGLPRRHLVGRHRRHRPGPRQRRDDQGVERRLLRRPAPPLHGRRVRQLHGVRRRAGPGQGHLPRPLRPARGGEANLRPGQLLPREPERLPGRDLTPLSTGRPLLRALRSALRSACRRRRPSGAVIFPYVMTLVTLMRRVRVCAFR